MVISSLLAKFSMVLILALSLKHAGAMKLLSMSQTNLRPMAQPYIGMESDSYTRMKWMVSTASISTRTAVVLILIFAGVTQCPIAEDETFTYKFTASQYGHTWYHRLVPPIWYLLIIRTYVNLMPATIPCNIRTE